MLNKNDPPAPKLCLCLQTSTKETVLIYFLLSQELIVSGLSGVWLTSFKLLLLMLISTFYVNSTLKAVLLLI